jgi:hypothetical protein
MRSKEHWLVRSSAGAGTSPFPGTSVGTHTKVRAERRRRAVATVTCPFSPGRRSQARKGDDKDSGCFGKDTFGGVLLHGSRQWQLGCLRVPICSVSNSNHAQVSGTRHMLSFQIIAPMTIKYSSNQ